MIDRSTIPFTDFDSGTGVLRLWPPAKGDPSYTEACQIGRERADRLVEHMQATQDSAVLGAVALSMRDDLGGMEAGFFQRLGEHLVG